MKIHENRDFEEKESFPYRIGLILAGDRMRDVEFYINFPYRIGLILALKAPFTSAWNIKSFHTASVLF